MPFSLADLKRSYGRSGAPGGPRDVRPYLFTAARLRTQRPMLARAIDWYASQVGRPRDEISFGELAQIAGDYRLARCLAACLEATFPFVSPDFEAAATERGGTALVHRLHEHAIRSPSHLRLFVFDQSSRDSGFVTPEATLSVLESAGRQLGCSAETVDDLLWLDRPAHERLTRAGEPPSPEALAAAYNRRALETVLCRTINAGILVPAPDGTAIRRFFFAIKRAGILCELVLQDPARGPQAGVWAQLFGPLEVFGPRTRHGDRFARALLELLRTFPGLTGQATVLINEREYGLHLTPEIATCLSGDGAPGTASPASTGAAAGATAGDGTGHEPAVVRQSTAGATFDSDVERRLYATLRGMERRGDSLGWTVWREPEPIIHQGTVLVPDFVLVRTGAGTGEVRVYAEVIGFWTPAYREKKKAKLHALAGSVDLVLVIQESLAADFEDAGFPILTYRRRPSAVDLIALLERTYPGGGGRPDPAKETVHRLLADQAWLAAFTTLCESAVPVDSPCGLEPLRDTVRDAALPSAGKAADLLEALLPAAGFHVTWQSLLDATVSRDAAAPAGDQSHDPSARPLTTRRRPSRAARAMQPAPHDSA